MAFFQLIMFSRLVTVWACSSQSMLVTCCLSVWKIQNQSITLVFDMHLAPQMTYVYLHGDADKSLARPGRKQATATKLGIYSTYSPWSSIHFLDHYSNFCKPLKKIQNVVRPTRSPRQQWPPHCTKDGDPSIVFSVQGPGGSQTGPDPENRVGDQDIGSPGRPVSSGLQVPCEPGHCHARTRPLWWPSCSVFPSKYPSIAPAEMSNTLRW